MASPGNAPPCLVYLAEYGSEDESNEKPEESESDALNAVSAILNAVISNVVRPLALNPTAGSFVGYRARSRLYSDSSSIVSTNDADKVSCASSSAHESDGSQSDADDSDIDQHGSHRPKRIEAPRVKGELTLDQLPPIEDLCISVPKVECLQIGSVSGIVDRLVMVQSLPATPALNIDTVLFLDHGQKALGRIFDVIGPVHEPCYCVRFNSEEQIRQMGVAQGRPVFYAPRSQHTTFVFLEQLFNLRGSDASWKNDVEPPPSCLDFSDDEQEKVHRQASGQRKSAFYRTDSCGTCGHELCLLTPRACVDLASECEGNPGFKRIRYAAVGQYIIHYHP